MIYAIGDIHGQKAMLDYALSLIENDGGPDAEIVFVGDYTDRGADSRAVIDALIEGLAAGRNWTCLKGNHDRMFSDFVTSGAEHDPMIAPGLSWVNPRLGGAATLASYGVIGTPNFKQPNGELEILTHYTTDTGDLSKDEIVAWAQQQVPQSHLDFVNTRALYHETDSLIFVHAGLRPNIPLAAQDPEDMMWIREGFLETGHDFGKLLVHGHTAIDYPTHYGTRVNIDAGAGRGRVLVPVVFEDRKCWALTDEGRVPVVPA